MLILSMDADCISLNLDMDRYEKEHPDIKIL